MAAAYCYEGIPLRFLASLFDIHMRFLVYMRYPCVHLADLCMRDLENSLSYSIEPIFAPVCINYPLFLIYQQTLLRPASMFLCRVKRPAVST